jgi:hypothetical protein
LLNKHNITRLSRLAQILLKRLKRINGEANSHFTSVTACGRHKPLSLERDGLGSVRARPQLNSMPTVFKAVKGDFTETSISLLGCKALPQGRTIVHQGGQGSQKEEHYG